MRHIRRKLAYVLAILPLGVFILYVIHHQRVTEHQNLNLRFDLPSNMENRSLRLKGYFNSFQNQLDVQQYQEDEKIYRQRKEYAYNYCDKRKDKNPLASKNIRDLTLYLEDPGILYCEELKAGSKFWRRAFEVLRRRDPKVVSPYQLSFEDFKESEAKIQSHFTEPEHREGITSLLESALKFVFVRDPYSRIFSTYVDKVLSPNAYSEFWHLGIYAIRELRNSSDSSSCGSDVTFKEFIQYLNTQEPQVLDDHVRQMSIRCDVCDIEYDVIGKMETFQTDVRYILKKVESFGRDISFKDMNMEYTVDYIVETVVRAFELKEHWETCITVHAANQRLWRQLQIAGIIDKSDTYSFSQEQSNNITVTEYLNMAFTAFKRASTSAKANKREALRQAYSTVPLKDLEDLRASYIDDFEMYDYEQRPVDVFGEKDSDANFDYFDVVWSK